MRSKPVLLIVLLLLDGAGRIGVSGETPASKSQMVHRDGSRILDGSGTPVKLRGVNLGGWLLWEPWMWGGHLLASESKLASRLTSIAGDLEMANFRRQIYEDFITEADIRRIAGLGFNVVRVPMNHSIFDKSDGPGQSAWQILGQLLSWAERYHVYVVLDLHSAPGGQSRMFTSDPEPGNLLWGSAESQSRTVALWRAIAQHYRDSRIVAGYDLLNEPNPQSGEQLLEMDRRIIAAIREVDPSHMVIVEGSKFATNFSMFSQPLSANQAYSFHMYTWKNDDRTERLNEYRRLSRDQNVPMWCGEFGENTYDMIESTLRLFENPENAVDGWTFWSWKKVPTPKPYLVGIQVSPTWKRIVERTSSPLMLARPWRVNTLKAMREFAQAVRLEHNVEDQRMMSILTSPLKR